MVKKVYRRIRSIQNGIKGLRKETDKDPKLRQYLSLSIGSIFIICIVQINWFLIGQVILYTALMIALELLNAAIEKTCDFIEPNHNAKIKEIKDVAAGAMSVVGFTFTGLFVAQYVYLLVNIYM